mmetsp:Transcript_3039/g.7979  ORF Transcript_3039/g.7979 Transcript_3039/m.7979 type:complete len:96 (-) Transcript_3039:293-580(-)|eukprot:1161106-Pelagomonas_calceolata.AAC.2
MRTEQEGYKSAARAPAAASVMDDDGAEGGAADGEVGLWTGTLLGTKRCALVRRRPPSEIKTPVAHELRVRINTTPAKARCKAAGGPGWLLHASIC